MRVLLIEDDPALCRMLADTLRASGYEVDACGDGEEGLAYLLMQAHDIVLLDRMLPKLDGVELLRRARSAGVHTPVLMITALDAIGDAVYGLDSGADDYLPKPFDTGLMLARMRALLRRPAETAQGDALRHGDITLLPGRRLLRGPAGEKELTRREFDLLELLAKSGGAPLAREAILVRVWGPDSDVSDGNLGNYILMVRRRLAQVGSTLHIRTLWGTGYALEETP